MLTLRQIVYSDTFVTPKGDTYHIISVLIEVWVIVTPPPHTLYWADLCSWDLRGNSLGNGRRGEWVELREGGRRDVGKE